MNNNYTAIIVDDEPDAVELLTARLGLLHKNINILGTYNTWDKALNGLQTQESDLLFMDVSMPGKNGINLLRLLPDLQSEIIFVTAHENYALDAFAFSTAGYILKPINDIELSAAIKKATGRINNKRLARQNNNNLVPKIGIPNNRGVDYIDVNDILYFESVQGYTKVVAKNTVILSSYRLGKFYSMLQGQPFFQVHRSYIVNLNSISRYDTSGFVLMSNNAEIPVSKTTREEFLQLFVTLSNNSNDDE